MVASQRQVFTRAAISFIDSLTKQLHPTQPEPPMSIGFSTHTYHTIELPQIMVAFLTH